MAQKLKTELKNAEKQIKKSLSDRDVSEWVYDNFHLIDKHYRAVLRDKNALSHPELYETLLHYLEDREYEISKQSLSAYLLGRGVDYTFFELSAVKTLVSACAIIKIASSLKNHNAVTRILPKCIKLLFSLSNPDFDEILPSVWLPEKRLSEFEPRYNEFDSATKQQYRALISDLATEQGISESEALSSLISSAMSENCSVGELLFRPKKRYSVLWLCIVAVIFSSLVSVSVFAVGWLTLLLLVPFGLASGSVADHLVSFAAPAYRAPRLELEHLPDNAKTLVTVASLLTGKESDDRVFESLARFSYMNPDDNIYFCLLADFPDSESPIMPDDEKTVAYAKQKTDELNARHGNRFSLFFRPRVLLESESRYGGHERKRGAVCELASAVSKGSSEHFYGGDFLGDIKYILTLDADTNLSVGSVRELVSIALHPANRPRVRDGRVASGYGIIQPSILTELSSAYKTGFSRLISGSGGADAYSEASFGRSQSLFGSGSFCGKGLIDVSLFASLVSGRLPDGLILSHDVIEGSMLRTLSATDVTLTDSTPANTVSFFRRLHRWIRGDFQNLYFLGGNLLTPFYKSRLVMTVLRHSSPLFVLLALVVGCFSRATDGLSLFLLAFSEFLLPCVVTALAFVFSGSPFAAKRFFSKAYSFLAQTAMRVTFEIVSTARRGVLTAHAFLLAGIRLITKKKTLEWTTAAQTELLSGTLGKFVLDSALSSAIGLAMTVFAIPPFVRFAGLLFFVYPLVSAIMSRPVGGGAESAPVLTAQEKKLLTVHARDMAKFYLENIGEDTHHLPPDNLQLSPVENRAMRTSPTNIGFYLLSMLASFDLGIISRDELYSRLDNSISTVEKLEKYHGNLYNWYDIETLSVIGDSYVSSVDCGNLIVMLVALKEGLLELSEERFDTLSSRCDKLIEASDLSVFYDERRSLFRIGVNGRDGRMDDNCYDLLMSEARLLGYFAVASSRVPKKHWQSLGRTLTHRSGYIGMLSWSGTAFEFLMPQLFLPLFRDSFLFESIAFSIMVQREMMPIWGVSESGYFSFDSEMNYQYKAHGLSPLALRRVGADERVVSPYSTYLALCLCGGTAIKNLKSLESKGMYGRYGMYEALDFNLDPSGVCVKSYMAHHVGMSLIACANAIDGNRFVRRFMSDRRMQSACELLCEKIPIGAHVFEDEVGTRAEPVKKARHVRSESFGINLESPTVKMLTRGDLTALISSSGHIGLRCGSRLVANTRFVRDSMRFSPGVIFSRGGEHFSSVPLLGGVGCGFEQGRDFASHIVSDKNFSGRVRFSMAKKSPCLVVNTKAESLKKYDITLAFEPVLESEKKFLSHISFSRLFVESEYDSSKRILYFHRRSGLDGKHIFTLAVAPRDRDMRFDFSVSRERLPASSISSVLDLADIETDGATGSCIDPLCLVRARDCEGGRATFLVTCGESKYECERNIRLARSDRNDYRVPAVDSLTEKLLPSLLYEKKPSLKGSLSKTSIGDLWSKGISGDYPIVLAFMSELAVKRTSAMIASFLKLLHSFIRFELVFVVADRDGYSRPIENSVRECISESGAGRYVGRGGGIFILREGDISEEVIESLCGVASYCVDFSGLRSDNSDNRTLDLRPIITAPKPALTASPPEKAFPSGNGYFTHEGYTVLKNRLPDAPYSYVLTGARFSTVLTQSSLGYTFFDNARERRICSFYGDPRSLDEGERIFLDFEDKRYDLCAVSHRVLYGKGFAAYYGEIEGERYELTVTVHPKFPIKLMRVKIHSDIAHTLSFSVRPTMGDTVYMPKSIELTELSASGNAILMFRNAFGMTWPEGVGFAGVFGGRTDPDRLEVSAEGNDVLFFLGACMTEQGAMDVAMRVCRSFFDSAIEASASFADSMIPKLRVDSGSKPRDVMLNFFLPYQVAACRFFARGSFYQSGGAYGFRDQLQDLMTLVYSMPDRARVHIIRSCAHQYLDGGVMHWWHTRHFDGVNRGIKSKCSDDYLFLPLVTADYIEKTGDGSLLDVSVYYLDSPPLGRDSERYEQPTRSNVRESVYAHCVRALLRPEPSDRHGLLLMGSCDWNDAFSLVGERGEGESVFTTMLYIVSAEAFLPIVERKCDFDTARRLRTRIYELREALEKNAYFGEWYARAFCDDGTLLGSEGSRECEIDILSQSFAVFSGLDGERTEKALRLAYDKLFDREARILRLFTPPFSDGDTRVGYIRGYVAGTRENGGQYTHGALWGALAFLTVGMADEGISVLDGSNPAYRASEPKLAKRFKTEPYAVCADIYSGEHSGRGGWSWYTGAASWFYRIAVENLLGLRMASKRTLVSACPVIEYRAELNLDGARVHITASRDFGTPTLDGREVTFPLTLSQGEHELNLPV